MIDVLFREDMLLQNSRSFTIEQLPEEGQEIPGMILRSPAVPDQRFFRYQKRSTPFLKDMADLL
jgi:hypothetical protein